MMDWETAGQMAFEWLSLYALHAKDCPKYHRRIVADGAYRSGLCKDYGGRYQTDEELAKATCECGLEEIQNALCQAAGPQLAER
jgi:hypothetical protein